MFWQPRKNWQSEGQILKQAGEKHSALIVWWLDSHKLGLGFAKWWLDSHEICLYLLCWLDSHGLVNFTGRRLVQGNVVAG